LCAKDLILRVKGRGNATLSFPPWPR
jgi:hypothetical protein